MRHILHIVHPWGGGISTYIEDLKQASNNVFKIFTMKSWQGLVRVAYEVEGKCSEKEYFLGKNLKLTDFENEKYARLLSLIIDEFDIDVVHVDSPAGHTFDILSIPAQKNIPIVLTVHDFFYICPTFHLVDNKGEFCKICRQGQEQHGCLKNHNYLFSRFDRKDLVRFRAKFRSLISNVDVFVFPSKSTKEIFSEFYDIKETNCKVVYHGTSLVKKESVVSKRQGRNFRVGILGSMLKHKGRASVISVMKTLEGHPVDFVHFGDGDLSGSNLKNLGRYEQGSILDLLHSEKIDVILLLSTWPETFSYTLSECIAANIPPIVTNMGALAERVSALEIGWLVDYKDIAQISSLILKLAEDDHEVEKYKKRISVMDLKSLSEMGEEYDHLYETILTDNIYQNRKVSGWPGEENSLIHLGNNLFFVRKLRLKMLRLNSLGYRLKTKVVSSFTRS